MSETRAAGVPIRFGRIDRVLLARARTLCCPMDRRTGRPAKVSDEVRAAFSTGPA